MNEEYHIRQFKEYLLSRKSKGTTTLYLIAVKQFRQLIPKEPKNINISDIRKYTAWIKENFHKNTQTSKFSAIRTYLWFIKEKYNNNLIALIRDLPPQENPLKPATPEIPPEKDILTKDEIQRLFRASERNPRDHAILKTLYYSTQRRSSIKDINLDNIDWNNETVTVKAKGDRTYTVDLNPDALQSIKTYLDEEREMPKPGHENALFLNGYGKRLDAVTIWRIVKKYALKIGLKKNVYPHLFRATACSHMDASGMTLHQIREQTGHKDVKSLRTYIRPEKDMIRTKVRDSLSLTEPIQKPTRESESKPPVEMQKEKKPPKDIAYNNTEEIRIKELELELLKLKLKQTNDVSIYG
ncbi:site-specific recombinase XerD [Thermoplasmatales archaeon SCGC AB-540-F20]|nr:site-specific recombinase XerD [Thermoplasmatales archaeon SCGC AB-540-F20]